MNQNATIQLTQLTAPNLLGPGAQSSWPLTVQALGTGMPSEIFVYQIVPPDNQIPGDRYQCVASVSQLSELPVETSRASKKSDSCKAHVIKQYNIPFYRSSSAQFVCHTLSEAQCIWALIQRETQRLVDNFNQCLNLQNTSVVNVVPSYPTGLPNGLPLFRLYPINGQVVAQLLDETTSLYHTIVVVNDSGVLKLEISDQGFPPIFLGGGAGPITSPGEPPLFRIYTISGQNVPQLLDTSTGLYHTLELFNDAGVLNGYLSNQGY